MNTTVTAIETPTGSSPAEVSESTHSVRGFVSLLITQFLGAANDNVLKGVLIYMVIDGAWKGQLGSGGQGIVSACLSIPFLLLSGMAGQFADRHSKRFVSILVKVVEIPIAIVAMIGFWTGNLWVTLLSLIALACQSAFFGPAKYGMIPELVPVSRISRANGLIGMMSNVAVIVGTLSAGVIADYYSPLPREGVPTPPAMLWLPGIVLVVVAVLGLMAISFMTPLAPGRKSIQYSWNPSTGYMWAIKEMAKGPLLLIAIASGYFYFLAGLALLIIPEYTVVLQRYEVSRSEVSVLLGILGLAIGIGSAVAGYVSGSKIRPVLIPIGGVALAVLFFLLGTIPPTLPDKAPTIRILFSSHAGLILGAGIAAGFYLIPLQALLQRLSTTHERGRVLGASSGISFGFLTVAALLYPILRPLFTNASGEHPEKIFLLCSGFMVAGLIGFGIVLKRSKLTLKDVS
ncbi:MFS transporter [Thalassoglobus sp. JC818]|uniref:MFS transporter n=1 Tax=Thalassoglobus sp. JC818 TaxID=3232136 RepID=UPI0034573C63